MSIFLVPMGSLFHLPGTIVWYGQFLALIIVGFLALSLYIWEYNRPLSLWSIYLLFSYIFVCQQHPRAMLLLIAAYLGILITIFVSHIKDTRLIYRSLIVMTVLQFLLVALQILGLDFLFKSITADRWDGIVGFVGSHNQLANYSASVAPILVALNPLLILISLVPLVASKGSFALLGLFVSLTTYFSYTWSKKAILIAFFIAIILGLVWGRYDSVGERVIGQRLGIWKLTTLEAITGIAKVNVSANVEQVMTSNPLTGFGLGNFMTISSRSQTDVLCGQWEGNAEAYKQCSETSPRYEHAHNDFIEAFFEFGFIGLTLILLCISNVLANFYHSVKTPGVIKTFCSLVALAIASLGVYVFHAPVSYFMFMLLLGLFYAEVNNAKQS